MIIKTDLFEQMGKEIKEYVQLRFTELRLCMIEQMSDLLNPKKDDELKELVEEKIRRIKGWEQQK